MAESVGTGGAGVGEVAGGRRVAAGVAGVAAAAALMTALLTGCGSGGHQASSAGTSSNTSAPAPTSPATAAAASTPAKRLPTAPNCGGGAYKPATLLIVCASGAKAVMATGVTWQSWDDTAAIGSGTMHILVHGRPAAGPASLSLAGVSNGRVGPQFSELTVTWIGSSPTGSPTALYHLQPGG